MRKSNDDTVATNKHFCSFRHQHFITVSDGVRYKFVRTANNVAVGVRETRQNGNIWNAKLFDFRNLPRNGRWRWMRIDEKTSQVRESLEEFIYTHLFTANLTDKRKAEIVKAVAKMIEK